MNNMLSSIKVMFRHQNILISIFILLFVSFVSTMFSERFKDWIGPIFDLERKNEILKFIGIGMGGVLVALQALMSYKRAKAMEDVAEAHAESNKNIEQGQRQERLKNAIEHLGHNSDSVRLGGAYELFDLAKETEYLRQTVLDILCAHIRQTTGDKRYQQQHKEKPSVEIQSLLTLLFVQEHDVFIGCDINLKECWLNGADLSHARLENAFLRDIQLNNAQLYHAFLRESDLFNAQLKQAYMVEIQMQEVFLFQAKLQGANLGRAKMQGADLSDAQLQGANLALVQLQGSFLLDTQLQEAHFLETQLQGSVCDDFIYRDDKSLSRIVHCMNQESDLSCVIFSGGLTQETLDSLVEDLCDDRAKELKEKLGPHVDRPISHQPPENVFTGTYSEEDVRKWDIEYRKSCAAFIR